MKKVLLVCDGSHFSDGAFRMAALLQSVQAVLLTGVFLGSEIYRYIYFDVAFASAELVPQLEDEQREQMEYSEERFKDLCRRYGIEYCVHQYWEPFTLDQLHKEMRFADLALIGSELFYKDYNSDVPNLRLRSAIHHAECPVVLVPECFDAVEKIILAYDGSSASVFAIKQFANLLPALCSKNTLLVYADAKGGEFPDRLYIEELAAQHFSELTIRQLDFDPQAYLATWLSEQRNSLVVAGAYGRSGFSNWLQPSFLKTVVAEHQLPLFIAHQ